tara:strand:- start:275 stop:481 length:207 start_codon:yes stop_codon:yes gene_type:complete
MSNNLDEIERRLAIHEAQCEERWKTIFSRMEGQEVQLKRMENILIGIAGTIIAGGGSVILTILSMHSS